MGLKLELSYEHADMLMASMLEELHEQLKGEITRSAELLPKGNHHRVDLADHHRILFASEILYRYYTGKTL